MSRVKSKRPSIALQCRGYDRMHDRSGFSQGKNMNENTWQQMLVDSFPSLSSAAFAACRSRRGTPAAWTDGKT